MGSVDQPETFGFVAVMLVAVVLFEARVALVVVIGSKVAVGIRLGGRCGIAFFAE